MTTETARELLYRHGLPEDVIDGALALHAQELATKIREDADLRGIEDETHLAQYGRELADLIDPTRAKPEPAPVQPTVRADAGQSLRAAEAELYVLLRKAGEERYEAQALIDRHRDEVLHRAELRRMAGEEQPATEAWTCKCPAELCRCHHTPAVVAQQDGAQR